MFGSELEFSELQVPVQSSEKSNITSAYGMQVSGKTSGTASSAVHPTTPTQHQPSKSSRSSLRASTEEDVTRAVDDSIPVSNPGSGAVFATVSDSASARGRSFFAPMTNPHEDRLQDHPDQFPSIEEGQLEEAERSIR